MNLPKTIVANKRYAFTLSLIAITTVFLALWIRLTDPHIKEVERYLKSNARLLESIGKIENTTLIKTTTFFRKSEVGAAKESSRKRYKFIANGASSKATVTVEVKILENDELDSIIIKEINL